MAGLPLIAAQRSQHFGRSPCASQRERLRKIVQVCRCRRQIARRAQLLESPAGSDGSKYGNRPAAVCDLDGLTGFDQTEQLTCTLPELSHADARHVLLVALRYREKQVSHACSPRCPPSRAAPFEALAELVIARIG